MGKQEDLEFVDLLENMSPEELSSLSEEEMDALLAAKMRVSADENPDDPHLASIAGAFRDGHDGNYDAQDGEFDTPSFGEPDQNYGREDPFADGFDVEQGEETGIDGNTDENDLAENPAVADSVGDAGNVDYDSVDNYEDEYTNDDYLGGDEPPQEPDNSFTPQRPQHPQDNFDENSLQEELAGSDVEGTDPFSDKVDLEDEKQGFVDKIKSLPAPVKFGVPVVLVVMALVISLISGGEENTSQPIGNGHAADQGGAAAPADGHAPLPDEGDTDEPVLLTDYIDTTSAKCMDNPASKGMGPTKAFSSIETDAWVCYRAMGIDGAVMNIVFREPVTLTEIRLTPGFNFLQQQSGEDKWVQHRVVSRILWRAGGQQFVQEIEPQRSEVAYIFDKPVTTESMSLTIQQSVVPDGAVEQDGNVGDGVFAGEQSNESSVGKLQDATAIQNLQIYGYPGKESAPGNSAGKQEPPKQPANQQVQNEAPAAPAPGSASESR